MCTRKLLTKDSNWLYYMNPAGTELLLNPIEITAKMMAELNGNIIESFENKRKFRHTKYYQLTRYKISFPFEYNKLLCCILHRIGAGRNLVTVH